MIKSFILIGGFLLLSQITAVFASDFFFNDVKVGQENYLAISFLKERGIISGYPDGSFRAKKHINRAEALKILFLTLNKAEIKFQEPFMYFPDVKKSDWFYDSIYRALQKNIVEGYSGGFFYPEKPISRAESLKLLLLEDGGPIPDEVFTMPYSDVPIDSWFAKYAKISKMRGLIIETRENGGQLLPDEFMTRGQFVELIYHFLKSSNKSKFGRATFYSDSLAGRGTSSGDKYHPGVFTTAHRTLPFGTKLLVTSLLNGQVVEVAVNDRGPYAPGIELDLSRSAFAAIANPSSGIIPVEYKIIP